ncbi:MAG: DUF1349 domain-containing protein [Bacillota bacterium]|nr:DUF1349 domain-containing protein [Bacillota bacterium]
MNLDISRFYWINKPKEFKIETNKIIIITEPGTDFWQRTYYGFRNDNAHAFMMSSEDNFTFTVLTQFNTKVMYDQCGVIVYQNSDNWFKASIEFENEKYQRLGSVVTNNGYSDWATTDISSGIKSMYYRLSRRGPDFLVENSEDGKNFKQMRVFHLFEGKREINFGVYACSPLESSFDAAFSEMQLSGCIWKEYVNPDCPEFLK